MSSFNKYYGGGNAETPQEAYTWVNMNDPRLNQLPGTLAPTGRFKKCPLVFPSRAVLHIAPPPLTRRARPLM